MLCRFMRTHSHHGTWLCRTELNLQLLRSEPPESARSWRTQLAHHATPATHTFATHTHHRWACMHTEVNQNIIMHIIMHQSNTMASMLRRRRSGCRTYSAQCQQNLQRRQTLCAARYAAISLTKRWLCGTIWRPVGPTGKNRRTSWQMCPSRRRRPPPWVCFSKTESWGIAHEPQWRRWSCSYPTTATRLITMRIHVSWCLSRRILRCALSFDLT